MPDTASISDLYLFPLSPADGHLTVLRADDHLLRRFGLLELVDLTPSDDPGFSLRAEADEIWTPVSGAVEVTLVDQRPSSPSFGCRMELTLDASTPQGLLIPFGVAHAFASGQPARLLRLSTHGQAHPEDRRGPADEIESGLPSGTRP